MIVILLPEALTLIVYILVSFSIHTLNIPASISLSDVISLPIKHNFATLFLTFTNAKLSNIFKSFFE